MRTKDAVIAVSKLLALIYALFAFVFGVPLSSPRFVWLVIAIALISQRVPDDDSSSLLR